MLVLTRKKGERVMIGDDIVVTIIDVRGDGVRIGFDAPRGIPIQRAEVISAVTAANTEAAATSGDALVGLLRARPRSSRPALPDAVAVPEATAPAPVPARPAVQPEAPLGERTPTGPAPKPGPRRP